MALNINDDEKRILASLTPAVLDRLADLIVARLTQEKVEPDLSKQVVTGSNPVSRSTKCDLSH